MSSRRSRANPQNKVGFRADCLSAAPVGKPPRRPSRSARLGWQLMRCASARWKRPLHERRLKPLKTLYTIQRIILIMGNVGRVGAPTLSLHRRSFYRVKTRGCGRGRQGSDRRYGRPTAPAIAAARYGPFNSLKTLIYLILCNGVLGHRRLAFLIQRRAKARGTPRRRASEALGARDAVPPDDAVATLGSVLHRRARLTRRVPTQ
jgi:hypothetical protein